MAQTIELEPSSVKRLLGLALLSIALILSVSTFTDKRITLDTSHSSIKLKSIGTPVYADAVPEILVPVEAPEPISEPKPAEVVQAPAPVVEAPVVAPAPPKPVVKPKPAPTPSDHASLMAQAGISLSDYGHVEYIIQKESGWRHSIKNKSSSAYGLCQTMLSIHPVPADFKTNPVTQLKWCNDYAIRRYGSWSAAAGFWRANRHW